MDRHPTSDEIAYGGSVKRCEQLQRMRRREIEPNKCDKPLLDDPTRLDDLIEETAANARDLAARLAHRNGQTSTDAAQHR